MAGLRFLIINPKRDAIVARALTASGIARDTPLDDDIFVVEEVRVAVGGGADAIATLRPAGQWECTASAPPQLPGGATVRIVATARGTFTTPDGQSDVFDTQTSLDVVLDGTVPDLLTIDSFATPVTTSPGEPYVLDLTGTAGDAQTGIRKVRVKVDGGSFAEVTALVDNGNGLWSWRQQGVAVDAGVHRFTVQAEDGAGNTLERTAEITVNEPFEPTDVEQAFEPTTYLRDLRRFARRYVKVDGGSDALTPAMLTARFHQPFDRLTEAAVFEQATRPLMQARVAVEVLRGRMGGPAPAELDQRFRGLAYQTFLRGLGSSYEELRLARTAEDASRQALAARLGIRLTGARPDRLDELTISPGDVTDDQLETLCGYRSTAPADPLAPLTDGASVLLWRRDALLAQWQDEDAAARDLPPRPIIDPDLVPESHLRNRRPDDAAYQLWTARRDWLGRTLSEIETDHAGAAPLARFDRVVSIYVGAVDLPALAALDADGHDVGPDLPAELRLDAFRFLARTRALLVEGESIGPEELADVFAILVQVQKRRQYQPWRTEERRVSLVLAPPFFSLDGAQAPTGAVSRWRVQRADYLAWRNTLVARLSAADALESSFQRVVDAAEAAVLPQLRDALVAELAESEESSAAAAERLTRELMIDLQSEGGQRTSRADQALETLRAALFSARSGRLTADAAGQVWTIDITPSDGLDFDREWDWMGSFRGWLSATRVFAYPENQLFPALYVADRGLEAPTAEYRTLIDDLRKESRLTPERAREIVGAYVDELRNHGFIGSTFTLTDQLSDTELIALQQASRDLDQFPHQREIFWLAPMAIAAKLQEAGLFQPALDWYQRVFAFHLPVEHRRVYHGLTKEADLVSTFVRAPEWLIEQLNPHLFALQRRNCYTKATILAIAGCFNAFADAEFARSSADGNARARTLYETAVDLLELPEAQPETGAEIPFEANPVWRSVRAHSRSGLAKIHAGLNIAGVATPTVYESTLPSQYRYSVLVDRAKNLVTIAEQMEAAYLAALEQRDATTYDEFRARNDLEVAGTSVAIHTTKMAEAVAGVQLAGLQRAKVQLQEAHFDKLLSDGYSAWEQAGLGLMGAAAAFHTASVAAFGGGAIANAIKSVLTFGLLGDPGSSFGQMLSAAASAASTGGQIATTIASFERRAQDWQFQKDLAAQDGAIADKHVEEAGFQLQLAGQERQLAVLQQDHAQAVATFLATRFTNAELFEWMSGVLGRVYAYFLQQASALAQLAEAQLAFERQELSAGFISSDYWRDTTAGAAAPDRRGLTGSARLLQDLFRLDQYAFDTDRRKLHLSQTFSLSQIAAFELQRFRETGVLTFATGQELFDREFPGHYLRLIHSVKLSMPALIPSVRGIRATLSASGVSRTVVARGPFDTVSLRRDPESIAFTSAANATGLFELEPESGMLRPFEGMGVDTVWQLEMPKAANPFDFRTIADVLVTVEYTALNSADYRQRVVRELDRRFSGDRSFSVRNQFPDAWYELSNPETVAPERQMRVDLRLTTDDFPPHIEDLRIAQISLFAAKKDEQVDELVVSSLAHTPRGQTGTTVTSAEVSTTGGVVSTRRPRGAAWNIHVGADPTGDWALQLADSEQLRTWFRDGLIDDLVVVLTLSGTTPEWP